MSEYTIRHYPHGIAIFGSIPLNAFASLAKMAESEGCDQMLPGVASALGAHFAFASKEGGDKWRAEIDAKSDWIHGTDTGTSSKTIWDVMTGQLGILRGNAGAPHDPDDFGRCYRLLKLRPEWIPRLPEVSEKYPIWRGLVREWNELSRIYERDLPTGGSRELYDRIRALRDEVEGAPNENEHD